MIRSGFDQSAHDALHVGGGQIVKRRLQVDLAQVDAEVARHVRGVALVAGELVDLALLASGLLLGAAHDHAQPLEEADVLGVAAVTDGAGAHVLHLGTGAVRITRGQEHRLGMAGGELAPALRRAGLEQDRGALGRGLRQMGPDHVGVEAPPVVDVVDLGGVGVDPSLEVADHGVVLPAALQQLVDHLDILIGALVALVVRRQPAITEVAPGRLQI
jgi:hypothetical protein